MAITIYTLAKCDLQRVMCILQQKGRSGAEILSRMSKIYRENVMLLVCFIKSYSWKFNFNFLPELNKILYNDCVDLYAIVTTTLAQ